MANKIWLEASNAHKILEDRHLPIVPILSNGTSNSNKMLLEVSKNITGKEYIETYHAAKDKQLLVKFDSYEAMRYAVSMFNQFFSKLGDYSGESPSTSGLQMDWRTSIKKGIKQYSLR